MKKPTLLITILALNSLFWFSSVIGAEQSMYDIEHPKSDLPPGGVYVAGQTNAIVQYYWTNSSGKMKPNGIYASTDGGVTWKLRCWIFKFEKVFVHAETAMLYAIIEYDMWEQDQNGYLTKAWANKIIMSKDARNWKDISPKPGWVSTMIDIFPDPEQSKRVCIVAEDIRPYYLQPVDDEYSDWKSHWMGWRSGLTNHTDHTSEKIQP